MNPNRFPELSIVIPVYNEELNVGRLHAATVSVLSKLNKRFEIIFVDDGSIDRTLKELKKLSPVVIVVLEERYGQSCAMDAGIKQAQGEIIVTMDGDGQNDPKDIPALLDKLEEGYDAVCGWRHQRQDPRSKIFISQGAALLRKIFVKDGVHDAGCTLRAYRKECFKDIDLFGGRHRMIPGILCLKGFKLTEIKVHHHPRLQGKTKYGWLRTLQGFKDILLVSYWRKTPSVLIARAVKYRIQEIIKIDS